MKFLQEDSAMEIVRVKVNSNHVIRLKCFWFVRLEMEGNGFSSSFSEKRNS